MTHPLPPALEQSLKERLDEEYALSPKFNAPEIAIWNEAVRWLWARVSEEAGSHRVLIDTARAYVRDRTTMYAADKLLVELADALEQDTAVIGALKERAEHFETLSRRQFTELAQANESAEFWKRSHATLLEAANARVAELEKELSIADAMWSTNKSKSMADANARIQELEARLKDSADDWKRIQDAERRVEELEAALQSAWHIIRELNPIITRTVKREREERDEYIKRYQSIELANKELTRNDHVNFGELMQERDALKAEVVRLKQLLKDKAQIKSDGLVERNMILTSERDQLRNAIERIIALTYAWVMAEHTIDCKHTYYEIREIARRALA